MHTGTNCLFCKNPTADSKSVEHIIPESLGSKKKVLPKGIVCDTCNNYFATKVENPILSHESFRNLRAYYQVPTKKGKIPSMLGKIAGTNVNVEFKLNSDNTIDVRPQNVKDTELFNSQIVRGPNNFPPLLFPVDLNPPKKLMSRFLAKMALEAVVYKNLHDKDWIEMVLASNHYDLIRQFARYGRGTKEWPYHQRQVFPPDTNMIHPDTKEWVQFGFGHDIMLTSYPETYFIFNYYGTEFTFNVGGPSIKGYELWLEENNNVSPLVERLGLQLNQFDDNGRISYFLVGTNSEMSGRKFDRDRWKRE